MTLRPLSRLFGLLEVASKSHVRRGKSRRPLRFDWLEARTLLNNAPWAGDDGFSTMHDTPLSVSAPGVLANDGDMDGDALSLRVVGGPSNGTLSGPSNDGSFTYTPSASYAGSDSFTYKTNDGLDESNIATVTITVMVGPLQSPTAGPVTCGHGPSQLPDALDDTATTMESVPVSINELSNDSHPDGLPFWISRHGNGGNGMVFDNGDGSLSYRPNPGFVGTDTFSYTIGDCNGYEDSAIVTITVDPSPDGSALPGDGGGDTVSAGGDTPTGGDIEAQLSFVATADAKFNQAIATARAIFMNTVTDAQGVYRSSLAAANADFDNARTDADAREDADMAAALTAYQFAVAQADATHDLVMGDAQTQLDAAVATYDTVSADLEQQEAALWNNCMADPACSSPDPQSLAGIQTALDAASAALETADHDFAVSQAAAEAARDSDEATAHVILTGAQMNAETAWQDAVAAADAVFTQTQAAAENTLLTAVSAAQTAYAQAQADAAGNRSAALVVNTGTGDGTDDGSGTDNGGVIDTDNCTRRINVSPTSGLKTTEDLGTDRFSVSLTCKPTASVTIGLTRIIHETANKGASWSV